MKKYEMKSGLMQLLVVMITITFCSVAQAARVNFPIDVALNDDHTALEVETNGRCANNNHKGCVEVAQGTQARLDFSFTGWKSCSLPDGRRWELGDVYLGGKNSATKPTSWGGFQNDYEVITDFNFADEATGRLNKEDGSNRNSIVIFDNNNSRTGGYDIWYKLTAVCVDRDGNVLETIETDPRIKNGGK